MELWDIYDKNKKLTGRTMVRNDWNMAPGDYHLTVLGVIQRPDGKYLISQRKMDKAWGAGWWEIPGGGVQAGETGEQSVRREVHEETGLNVTDVPCELVYTYERVNPEEKNNYFVDIYRFVLDFDESMFRSPRWRISALPRPRKLRSWAPRVFSCTMTA